MFVDLYSGPLGVSVQLQTCDDQDKSQKLHHKQNMKQQSRCKVWRHEEGGWAK